MVKKRILRLCLSTESLSHHSLYHVGNQYDLIYHWFTSLLLRPKICAKVTQILDITK